MNWSKIGKGCGIGCAVLVVLIVVGGIVSYKTAERYTGKRSARIAALRSPGVVLGTGTLTRGVFLTDPRLGNVTDIVLGRVDPRSGHDMAVVGTECAAFVGRNGTEMSVVSYGSSVDKVSVCDIENDGACEFVNRGSWGVVASLMDHSGKELWNYGSGMSGVDDMCAGDVNGDGFDEFSVGFNGGGGIHLLDRSGKTLWRKPGGNIWHVEMADATGDGRPEIIHSDASGRITIRDKAGSVVSQIHPPEYVSHFSLLDWPGPGGAKHLIVSSEGKIRIIKLDGTIVRTLAAPKCADLGDVLGTAVRLKKGGAPYLAAVVSYHNEKRSIFYLYGSGSNPVYQEVLAEWCPSIAAVDLNGSGIDTIVIGGDGKVWKYDIPREASAQSTKRG